MNKTEIMDSILEMMEEDDLENKEFETLCNKNLSELILYIHETEDGKIIDEIEECIGEYSTTDLWDTFKENIYSRTGDFLATIVFRHLDEEKKLAVIGDVFEWRYNKKETADYISKQMGEKQELIVSIFHLFAVCESLIIMQDVSQRRFLAVMISNLKFSEQVGLSLWKIFEEHRSELEKKVLYNRISYINSRVKNLEKQSRKWKEDIEFLCYMSLEKDTLK